MFGFLQSVQSIHKESEADCVSDERYASERKFALQHLRTSSTSARCTRIHRTNFRTHHGCMGVWGKKSPAPEISAPREKRSTDFAFVRNEIGHTYAATGQISPTRCRFGLVVRYDYDAGRKTLVGRFKRSVCFVARSPRTSVNT